MDVPVFSNDNSQRNPPSRHPRYDDSEYLTFAVDGYLFRLPVRRLKESEYFQNMLGSEHLGGSVKGTSGEHPIALGDITSFEMECFVEVLDARVFGKKAQREWKRLAAALRLATMWEFDDVRTSLIEDMSQIISKGGVEPVDRVEASIQCRVSDWLHPAYQALCERAEGITVEEAKRLGMDRLAAIYRVRDRRHTQPKPQNTCTHSQYCSYCNNGSKVHIPTLDLIKAEHILSSVELPLSCTCSHTSHVPFSFDMLGYSQQWFGTDPLAFFSPDALSWIKVFLFLCLLSFLLSFP